MNYPELLEQRFKYNERLNSYVNELRRRAGDKMLKEFSEYRGFSMKTIKDCGIFYIGNPNEMLLPDYIEDINTLGVISPTNHKPIFTGRYVIPIKDIEGNVLNLVGYSSEADERYIYGNSRYYRRRDDMWGLENLPLAYELGYAIVTEGITDAIALRNIGYPVAFARCGTRRSDFAMKQLNRCRFGIIRLGDRDKAGKKAIQSWECNRYVTLNTYIKYKDVDEMIKKSENGVEWVSSYLDRSIEWLKTKEHKGFNCEKEEVTMY